MRKHLLQQLTLALLLTAAVPTLTAQVHVGDILCEGNLIYPPSTYPASGATAIGVVFYVDNTGQHGWAVALQDVGGTFAWSSSSNSDTQLPNYNNKRQAIYNLDGYENTRIVRQNGTSTSRPAFFAVDFANGWYLPAIGQLNYLFGNMVEVNASLNIVGGRALFTQIYWSSTEASSSHAWYLNILSGTTYFGDVTYNYYSNVNKTNTERVRAVRNF